MILILLDSDKKEISRFGIGDSVQSLIREIKNTKVETIVAGENYANHVAWEKQFQAVDVMPSSFDKKE